MGNGNAAIILLYEDWEGLYLNGKLVNEGHRLFEGGYLSFIRFVEDNELSHDDITERDVKECCERWALLDNGGRFYTYYSEFVKAATAYEKDDEKSQPPN